MTRSEREQRWTHTYLAGLGWRVFEGEELPRHWFFGDGEVRVYLRAIVSTSVKWGYCGCLPAFCLVYPRALWVVDKVALMVLAEAGEDVSAPITGLSLRDHVWWAGAPTIEASAVAGAIRLEPPRGIHGLDYHGLWDDEPSWSAPVVDGQPGSAPAIRVKPTGRRATIAPILDAYTSMAKWVCERVSTPEEYLRTLRASARRAANSEPEDILRARSLLKIITCDLGAAFLAGDLGAWHSMMPTWERAADALRVPLSRNVRLPVRWDYGDKRLPRLRQIVTFENIAARMQRILDEDGIESLGRPPEVLVYRP